MNQRLATFDSRLDQTRLEIDKVKHQVQEVEKANLNKNNNILSTFIDQLQEFETRENEQIARNSERFNEINQMVANVGVDAQKNLVKFEKEIKKSMLECIERIEGKIKDNKYGSQAVEKLID